MSLSRSGGPLLRAFVPMLMLLLMTRCKDTPKFLTAEIADRVVRGQMFASEPVYAEVPQKVSFGPRSPKDDFDEKSVSTLGKLERAGLITVKYQKEDDGTETYRAKVTKAGFNILGTMPSARGAVYRGTICEKRVDGTRNFIRHPNDSSVGRIEVVWHYDNPTRLYPMFDTKLNKPLKTPFISLVSLHWEKRAWHFDVVVRKEKG